MHRKSISKKLLYGIAMFTLIIILVVSSMISYGFIVLSTRHFIEDTSDFAGIAASVIDGDRIRGYAETGEKDDYYYEADAVLCSIKEKVDLNRIMILVPYDDYTVCIWDTGSDDGRFDLGHREEYEGDDRRFMAEIFTGESEGRYMHLNAGDEGQFMCVFSPLLDSKGEPAAIVYVIRKDIDIKGILAQFLFMIALSTILVSSIIMHIAYRQLRKSIIKPIAVLTDGADRIVGSIEREEELIIDLNTNDELETLADAFNKMGVDLRKYIREVEKFVAEKERMTAEISVAAQIQQDMMPKLNNALSESKEFDLAAYMKPAKLVGGDFYDFFMIDDRHLALVIADVSGKGIPAALFMVVSKVLIKNSIKGGMAPAEALSIVNERLLENEEIGYFVTVWLAVIDIRTGKGIAANAGHEHPVLRHAGGSYELVKYKHSPAVATIGGITFMEHEFTLDPGDMILVYTDGVTEATDSAGVMFGENRLIEALNRCGDSTPDEALKTVRESIEAFTGEEPQFDDITMLAMRYNGR